MGTICILLGCIVFCLFVLVGCAGGVAASKLVSSTLVAYAQYKDVILAGVIAVFALIGLLICLSLVMHGLTYNKINKTYKLLNAMQRKNRKN